MENTIALQQHEAAAGTAEVAVGAAAAAAAVAAAAAARKLQVQLCFFFILGEECAPIYTDTQKCMYTSIHDCAH